MTARYAALMGALILSMGCASKLPNLTQPVEMTPIKEYEDKVAIKEIKSSEVVAPSEAKVEAKPTPKLGLEPVAKKELKGKKKKKSEASGGSEVNTQSVEGAHLPEIEDGEGFMGRRPLSDPYRVGEKVTLMVTYFGVSAGDATLEVKPYAEVNGRKAYHFYSKLVSSSVFSMFYKVDDYCESYYACHVFTSRRTCRSTNRDSMRRQIKL
jgi:hypothetical protein